MFCSSLLPFVGCSCFINVICIAYWLPTHIPYHNMFLSFYSNTTVVTSGARSANPSRTPPRSLPRSANPSRTPPRSLRFLVGFVLLHIHINLLFCVVFCRLFFVLFFFFVFMSFNVCIVIYDFWYLQNIQLNGQKKNEKRKKNKVLQNTAQKIKDWATPN